MPAKDQIRTAAYRLPLPADLQTILGDFYSFHVPASWPDLLRKVWQRDWDAPRYDLNLNVGHVNMALRAVAPEVLDANGWKLDPSESDNWLYARQPVNTALLKRVMQAYLQESLNDPEKYPELREAVNGLDVDERADDWHPVDATQFKITTGLGGAAVIPRVLYRLIPEVVAERIANLDRYDGQLSFLQVPSTDGAELMSWPPSEFEDSRGKGDPVIWRYSALLKVALRTVPFDPVPRLHLSVGIRRWIPAAFSIPRRSVSVYLLPPSNPTETNVRSRFALASLVRGTGSGELAWRGNGPAEILGRLNALSNFPDPTSLKSDASAYLSSSSGFQAAVLHHTQMPPHAVETGILPDERRRLLEWAARALPDGFEEGLVLKPTRSFASRTAAYVARKPVPKEPRPPKEPATLTADKEVEYAAEVASHAIERAEWAKQVEAAKTKNAEIDAENARRHRDLLAKGLDGHELRVDVLADTTRIRDALTAAAGKWLGLSPCTDEAQPNHVVFRGDEVTVRLIHHRPGRMTSALGGAEPPGSGDAFEKAVEERATIVQRYLDDQEFVSELVLAEIPEPKNFRYGKQRADPYNAIRQGAARAKRVTQFITTGGKDKYLAHRADAAWADGIRSLGITLVPQHSADLAIPPDFDQVAFWVARRNTSRSVRKPVYLPVAVLVRKEAARVMARTPETVESSPETNGWLPYNLVLCELACAPPRDKEMANADRQSDELARFVRLTLQQLRGRPTLLLVDATNLRYRWSWFKDDALEPDRFSTGVPMALSAFDKQLRVVRVRSDAGRDETPMWWGLDSTKPEDLAGYSKGLWEAHDATSENRVFLSTADKNPNLNSLRKDIRKLTRNGEIPPSPDKPAPGPKLLEITVAGLAKTDAGPEKSAVDWATFVHQQRFTPDYPTGLSLPYVLKLCSKAADFAYPEERSDEPEDEPALEGGDDAGEWTLPLDF